MHITESRFKDKHSLDSDEEDNEEIPKKMVDDDIEGQEESTVDFDDGIKVTPFNLREEMEEGWECYSYMCKSIRHGSNMMYWNVEYGASATKTFQTFSYQSVLWWLHSDLTMWITHNFDASLGRL